jgi:hypothetical protein
MLTTWLIIFYVAYGSIVAISYISSYKLTILNQKNAKGFEPS